MPRENKVCPIMSFHHPGAKVWCLRDECVAWEKDLSKEREELLNRYKELRNLTFELCWPGQIAKGFFKDTADGYCKLIERRS